MPPNAGRRSGRSPSRIAPSVGSARQFAGRRVGLALAFALALATSLGHTARRRRTSSTAVANASVGKANVALSCEFARFLALFHSWRAFPDG